MKKKRRKKQQRKKIIIITVSLCLTLLIAVYVFRAVFRTKYDDLIEKYAAEYEIEPAVLYGFIKTESNFNPYAVSSAGAKGLMQITPETFEWLQYKLGENLPESQLFEPETNIRYGAYLLSYLLDEFEFLDTAAAAYNAGISCVKSWLKNSAYSSDGKRLSYIPYGETRYYVTKIKAAIKSYEILEGD